MNFSGGRILRDVSSVTWKQLGVFFAMEAAIFVLQVTTFFLTAVFFSYFLSNEQRLSDFANSKINAHTSAEFGFTLLSITVVLGALTLLSGDSTTGAVKRIAKELRLEVPRTIYFFGATITACALAIAFALAVGSATAGANAARSTAMIAAVTGIVSYLYGALFKAAFQFGFESLWKLLRD